MGSGGGSSAPSTQVVNPERVPGPLESGAPSHLFPQFENMLEAGLPFSQFGAGYQLMPRSPFGQVYAPGPNPTIFGNPYMARNHNPYFGESALNAGGSMVPQNPSQQNGMNSSGGMGKLNSGAFGQGQPNRPQQPPSPQNNNQNNVTPSAMGGPAINNNNNNNNVKPSIPSNYNSVGNINPMFRMAGV